MISAANAAVLLNKAMDVETPMIPLKASGKAMDKAQAEKLGQDFESMFVAQMLEQMFGESLGTEAFGDEETSEIYKGLMMDAYGKEISKAGGIGIAAYVQRELLKTQEV